MSTAVLHGRLVGNFNLGLLKEKVFTSSYLAQRLVVDARQRVDSGSVFQSRCVASLEIATAVFIQTLYGMGKVGLHGLDAIAHTFYARKEIVQDLCAAGSEISLTLKFLVAGVFAACAGIFYPKTHSILNRSDKYCKSAQEKELEKEIELQKQRLIQAESAQNTLKVELAKKQTALDAQKAADALTIKQCQDDQAKMKELEDSLVKELNEVKAEKIELEKRVAAFEEKEDNDTAQIVSLTLKVGELEGQLFILQEQMLQQASS